MSIHLDSIEKIEAFIQAGECALDDPEAAVYGFYRELPPNLFKGQLELAKRLMKVKVKRQTEHGLEKTKHFGDIEVPLTTSSATTEQFILAITLNQPELAVAHIQHRGRIVLGAMPYILQCRSRLQDSDLYDFLDKNKDEDIHRKLETYLFWKNERDDDDDEEEDDEEDSEYESSFIDEDEDPAEEDSENENNTDDFEDEDDDESEVIITHLKKRVRI